MSTANATMTITVTDDTQAIAAAVEDEVREWIFTFGFGQRLVPLDSSGRVHDDRAGVPLAGLFARISGTWHGARVLMHEVFGQVYCDQYESEDAAGVKRWGLREIPLPADLGAWLAYEGRRPE